MKINKQAVEAAEVPEVKQSGTDATFTYTPQEQALADQLKSLMSATDRSTLAEGKAWFEARELTKKDKGRFDLFYGSLGAKHARIYYAIGVYEASLIEAVVIPPSVQHQATKAGIDLSKPAQKAAVQRAIVDAKFTGEPTYRQTLSIINAAIETIEAAEESGGEETEEQLILASFNAVFTSSYRRVVGTPVFKTIDKKRTFTGTKNEDGVLMSVGSAELQAAELAWAKTMHGITRQITGKGPLSLWLAGGPDISCLGRGTDQFTLTDVNQGVAA
jgi:hypothetical protein